MFSSSQAGPLQSVFVALFLLILGLSLVALLKSPNRKYISGLFFFGVYCPRNICICYLLLPHRCGW